MRVWAIGRAAIACTALVDLTAELPDDPVRVLLAEHFTEHQINTHPVGALFGALTTDKAIALWDMAEAINPTPTTP